MSSKAYSCDGGGTVALNGGLSALATLRKQLQTKEAKIGKKKSRKAASASGMGTGYGGGAGVSTTAAAQKKIDSAHQSEVETDAKLCRAFADIRCVIACAEDSSTSACAVFSAKALKTKLSAHSAFRYFLSLLLRNDSITDIDTRKPLYLELMDLLTVLARDPLTAVFLMESLSEDEGKGAGEGAGKAEESSDEEGGGSVVELMRELDEVASTFISLQNSGSGEEGMALEHLEIAFKISEAASALQRGCANVRLASAGQSSSSSGGQSSSSGSDSRGGATGTGTGGALGAGAGASGACSEKAYVKKMRPLRFAVLDMVELIDASTISHAFMPPAGQVAAPVHSGHAAYLAQMQAQAQMAQAQILAQAAQAQYAAQLAAMGVAQAAAPGAGVVVDRRAWLHRIASEVATLSKSLPVNLASSIFVRVDEARMDVIKALVIGPEETPYANGCFEFDFLLPPNYPQAPPKCLLKTTGRGSVRFNPNLYNCGKVCLSLLGTWAGPSWDPSVSTLLQVLISLQSLILVPDPYFNEPGYERSRNTPQGQAQSDAYNAHLRTQTARFAILEPLKGTWGVGGAKSASAGGGDGWHFWSDVVREHFNLKGEAVAAQLREWEGAAVGGAFERELQATRRWLAEEEMGGAGTGTGSGAGMGVREGASVGRSMGGSMGVKAGAGVNVGGAGSTSSEPVDLMDTGAFASSSSSSSSSSAGASASAGAADATSSGTGVGVSGIKYVPGEVVLLGDSDDERPRDVREEALARKRRRLSNNNGISSSQGTADAKVSIPTEGVVDLT